VSQIAESLTVADDDSAIIDSVGVGICATERVQEPNPSGMTPVERPLWKAAEAYYLVVVVNPATVGEEVLGYRAEIAYPAVLAPEDGVERSVGIDPGRASDVTEVVNAITFTRRTTW